MNTLMICAGSKAENFWPEGWTAMWVFRGTRITRPRVPDAVQHLQREVLRRRAETHATRTAVW
jgi:hypothetical protein